MTGETREAAAGAGSAPSPAPSQTPPAREPSPLRAVLALPAFRFFLVAMVVAHLVAAGLRFSFVWLALDVSDHASAAGIVSFAAGLPAVLLSLPAGVWSDRLDRWWLIVGGSLAAAACLAGTALGVVSGVVGLLGAALCAAAVASAHAVYAPAHQAVVPQLVPTRHLTSAVAVVTIAGQGALFAGGLLNGAVIREAGVAGAFAWMGILTLLSVLAMLRVRIPPVRRAPHEAPGSALADTRAGLRFALGGEPFRSLVASSAVIGTLWGVVQINLPELSKEILGQGPFASSALLAAFAPGMLISLLWIASRRDLRRHGRLFGAAFGLGLGSGALCLGLSTSYALSLAVMAVWGVFGGVALTALRSLLQALTPDAMMGRTMGIWTLAMMGSFPISAGLSAVLAPRLGPDGTITAVALATVAIAPFLAFRRSIWNAEIGDTPE